MDENSCSFCTIPPYTSAYAENIAMSCRCGNILKIRRSPIIYLGVKDKGHVVILPFPGCTVCGLPQNLPWTVILMCQSEGERAQHFREVYHNYGARN